jgi:hypothetical protein
MRTHITSWTSLPQDERLELILTAIKENPALFTNLFSKPAFQELLARLARHALFGSLDTNGEDLSDEMGDLVLHELGPLVAEIYEKNNEYFEDLAWRERLKTEMRLSPEQQRWL